MKAVFFEKMGGVEVLQYGDFPMPEPAAGEALIKVKACALNRLDIWLREDEENSRNIPLPHVPGSDVAGIVEKINGESSLEEGQEVVVNPAIPCGQCSRCAIGDPCELVNILGVKNHGGYAEYIAVPIEQVYPKPANLTFVEAAAFPLTFLTAWHMLIGRADLQAEETVFVWGASGGLGSAAIQVAHHVGATVIAAAKSKDEANRVEAVGADNSVIYTNSDVVGEASRLTDGQGVDVVFESVGKETWEATLSMLRPFGRVVIAGTTSGDVACQDLSDIYVRQLSIFGARMGTKQEFETMLGLIADGSLKPVIDTIFPLAKAADAQARLLSGEHVGKIVLEIG